jgi:DNA repair protein RecO (recombination protein O)
MSASKTLAFVLGARDYRDTSILGSFYTREYGKIRGIVKGVRDARARFGSTLEPFSLNEILFYKRRRGAELQLVTQVDLVDLFLPVREDLEKLAYASYFAELVDELVEPEDPNPEIFDLLRDALVFLTSGASAKRAARIFEVKLFDILGLMPEIKNCIVCQAEMAEGSFFSVPLGGIRCRPCTSKAAQGARTADTSPAGFPVSRGTLNFMDHVRRAPVAGLYQVKVAQEVGGELEKILRRFVDFHLQNKLKTVVFLEKMGFN